MQNNKKTLYFAIANTSISFVLLIVVCSIWFKSFGWFSSNESGNIDGVIATTKSNSVKSLDVKAYYLTKENYSDSYYVIDSEITKENGLMSMHDYNDVDYMYTAVLLQIDYEVNETGNYKLSLKTNIDFIYEDDLSFADFKNNYLSNVISAYKTENVNDTFTLGESASFISGTDTYTKNKEGLVISNTELSLSGTMYCIIDYNEDYINYIYNVMIDKYTDADLTTEVEFQNDLIVSLMTA